VIVFLKDHFIEGILEHKKKTSKKKML